MKRMVACGKNTFVAIPEEGGVAGAQSVVEVVITTIEPDYDVVMAPPLIEGGNTRATIGKTLKAKSVRFFADIAALKMLIVLIESAIEQVEGLVLDVTEADDEEPKGKIIEGS